MATREELYTALRNAHAAGDTKGAATIAAYLQSGAVDASQDQAPARSKSYEAGRGADGWKQGLASVINGPLMGFGDEILGAVGGAYDTLTQKGPTVSDLVTGRKPKSFLENYRENRDYVRGMQDNQEEVNPWTTGITRAMASGPLLVRNLAAKEAAEVAPMVQGLLPRMGQAAATGAKFGTVQGVGDSTADNFQDMALDGLKSGVISAGTSAATLPIASAVKSVSGNVTQRLSAASATRAAEEKIAEAIARDARGNAFKEGLSNPAVQLSARLKKLGPEATITDAAGSSTNRLLDVLATLPGKTKDAVEQVIHSRQATRSGRLVSAAEQSLGVNGQRLAPNLEQWVKERSSASAPLYAQLRDVSVQPTPSLTSLVQTADELGATQLGREMATARQMTFSLDAKSPSQWSMSDLDHVKQGLDQILTSRKAMNADGTLTPLGLAFQDLKSKLVKELDQVTTDPNTGASLYKAARDAFAGPSAIIDAANQGRMALSKDGPTIAKLTGSMSDSESQAFRLGAFESLRAKLGKESGQTEILKMWKEPATREKLAQIFGDERSFREFAASVAKEARLKPLESVGRGSQTAARQYGAGDLDINALSEAGGALAAAKTGNVLTALGSAKSAWSRVSTPEPVRNKIGELLLSNGTAARENANRLRDILLDLDTQNSVLAQGSGLIGTQLGSRIAVPQPPYR